ncbi:hypothetical protein JCM3770_004018 [Rhodotorula araucariae]
MKYVGPGTRRQDQDKVKRLDDEVEAFVAWVRPTRGEHDMRLRVLECFKKVVAKLWPTAQVELFGSMTTGLYLPGGDFDIVILDDTLHEFATTSILDTLQSAVLRSGFASSVRLVSTAKVPLVKLVTAPEFGSFAMDVSFNSPKGPKGAEESVRLLQELEHRRPGARARIRALVFALKALLLTRKLAEVKDGGLGGMGVFCLAISFLQLDTREPDQWTPGYDLLSFLWKYSYDFNYRHDCIITGDGGKLAPKAQMGWNPDRLSIQHPVDPKRDLTSGTYEIKAIRRAIEDAYRDLAVCLSLENGCVPLPPGRSALERAGIRLPAAMVEQRRANRELDSGGLAEHARTWDPQIDDVVAAWTQTPRYYWNSGLRSASTSSFLTSASTPSLPPPRPHFPPRHLSYHSYPPPAAPHAIGYHYSPPPISPTAASPNYPISSLPHAQQNTPAYLSSFHTVHTPAAYVYSQTVTPSTPYSPSPYSISTLASASSPYPRAATHTYTAGTHESPQSTTPSCLPSFLPSTTQASKESASPRRDLRYASRS